MITSKLTIVLTVGTFILSAAPVFAAPKYSSQTTYYSDATLRTEIGELHINCSGGPVRTGQGSPYYTKEIIDYCGGSPICPPQGACIDSSSPDEDELYGFSVDDPDQLTLAESLTYR